MPGWLIGSSPSSDLVVDHPSVAGHHCLLTRTPEGYFLEDLGTSQGTFVNGTRVEGRVSVDRSDVITLAGVVPMPWPPATDPLPQQAPKAEPRPQPAPDHDIASAVSREPASEPEPEPRPAAEPTSAFESEPSDTRVITIGREPDNDMVIDASIVSGWHARVVIENGRARIEDLGSSNGTYVNSREYRIKSAPLAESDVVFLGSYRLAVARILAPRDGQRAAGSFLVTFRGLEMLFGRGHECDQVLDYPMVSRRHARLSRSGDVLRIEDLGSSNGTYVNGVRVREPVVVRPGDRIGLGSYTFTLTLSGDLEECDGRDDLTLEAHDLDVEAGGKTLIAGVSLVVRPGEIVGLMGPSGAGKSTLLRALGGYIGLSRGAVLLNGIALAHHFAEYRGQIGFVPQEDIIHRDLTVGEALWYAARLRLPADYSATEIRQRVANVLTQLDLTGCAGVLIGSPSGSGISGGQRRRVNLAMELLTDPPVLLLDEPTSGLSSEDALLVMKLLKKLADRGKTILLAIHQPGRDLFRALNRVVVIARDPGTTEAGRLAYDGRAYPDAILFFNPALPANLRPTVEPELSPDDLLKGLARRSVREWVERLEAQRRRVAPEPSGSQPSRVAAPGPIPQDLRRSAIAQWWTLVRRNIAIKRKDRWNTAILLAQAPIIALLIVLVFGEQPGAGAHHDHWTEMASGVASTTFILGLAALWFGCSNAVREIVAEWPVYQRERMVNLKLAPYIASKLTTLGALCLFQCAILLAFVRFGSGLKGDWLPTFGILILASSVGMAIGLVISAMTRTSEVAIALLPLVILPMLIFGGALQPLHKMHPSLRFVCNTFPSRWAFEGLIVLESERRPFAPTPAVADPATLSVGTTSRPRDMAERYFPAETDRMGPRAAAVALAGTLVFLISLIATTLRLRDLY
jgi:ABC-type multidrug transport system ATPase subunit/pSer/pThr/pTyr-binding forkhead associated (FHA) protein